MNQRQIRFVLWITMPVVIGMLAGGKVQAQNGVFLEIQSVANRAENKHTQSMEGFLQTEESVYNRTETYKITLRSMLSIPVDYVLEWKFLAKNVATKQLTVYDGGARKVILSGGSVTNFDVQCKPLTEGEKQYFYVGTDDNGNPVLIDTGHRTQAGAKPTGYVFLLKTQNKLVAVEASDPDLKESDQKAVNPNRLKLLP